MGAKGLRAASIPRRLLVVADAVVALGLGVATVPAVLAAGTRVQAWTAGLLAAVICLAVATRRRWPATAVLTAMGAISLDAAVAHDVLVSQAQLALMLAAVLLFYGAGAFARPPADLVGLVLGVAFLLPQIFLSPATMSDLFFEPVILGFVPWGSGRLLRELAEREQIQRDYAALVQAQVRQQARLAARSQATDMARELHDSLGHRLSVIVLQASGARLMLRSAPDRSTAALGVIEDGCREALAELRRLAGAAYAGTTGPSYAGTTEPSPGGRLAQNPRSGIGDIEALTSQLAPAGLVATCVVEGSPRPVPPGLALSAYRIVQEALTNTIKHAQATQVTVMITWQPDQLIIRVADNGREARAAATASGTGQGITGMRERAALNQGTLTAGPTGSGYVVAARFPVSPGVP